MKTISNQDADTLVRALPLLRAMHLNNLADENTRRRAVLALRRLERKPNLKDDTIMANINDNAAQSASQTKQILEYLRAGNRITPLEALRLFGTMRLNARIWDIECLTGIRPKRKRVRVQTANGGTAIVMQYWL